MGLLGKAKNVKKAATTREGRLGIAAGAATAAIGTVVPGVGVAAPVVAKKVTSWAQDNPETIDAIGAKVGEGISAVKGRLSHFKDGIGTTQPTQPTPPTEPWGV